MANLSDQDRLDLWGDLMRKFSASGQTVNLNKVDLRTALNAADQWCTDNAAAFNTALPAAAQTGLSQSQKAELLAYVALKRWGG